MEYKYKLVCYRKEDGEVWKTDRCNNLEWCKKQASKSYQNYYHKIFEKIGNKWIEIPIK